MGGRSTGHNWIRASRLWLWGMALLSLVGCGPSVALGERFTLREGQTVKVNEAGLTITVEGIMVGLPGSQDPEDGGADLWVVVKGEGEESLSVHTGMLTWAGGYKITMWRLVHDADGLGCELEVSGP